jgi:SAM-dependent methyltransferase
MAEGQLPVEERMLRLLDHLGVKRAHFAANAPQPIERLLATRPSLVASTVLVRQSAFDTAPWRQLGDRLMVVYGDGRPGPELSAVRRSLSEVPDAAGVVLQGYPNFPWSDVVADRTEEVDAAVIPFLDRLSARVGLPAVSLRESEGDVAGLTYRIRGSGPPLVLLPLFLAPTQWDALLSRLAASYCTISLGGQYLGVVANLEERASTWGFQKMVGSVVDEMALSPGDAVVEVGSGSGAVCRWLAARTDGRNPITGVDVSPYMVREAEALAAKAGLADQISFRQGNAEALPFADASFDVTLSVTVMEEVDADRMLHELVRVTKPGGRIGVVVRATDFSPWYNVILPLELKTKIEQSSRGGAAELGCADESLYRRFRRAVLVDLKMWPQVATFHPGRDIEGFWIGTQNSLLSTLDLEEAAQWHGAVVLAQADGGLMWTTTYHCAVGTTPQVGA